MPELDKINQKSKAVEKSKSSFNAMEIFLDKNKKNEFIRKLLAVKEEIAQTKKNDLKNKHWINFIDELNKDKDKPVFSNIDEIYLIIDGFIELLKTKVGLVSAFRDIGNFRDKLDKQKDNIDKISNNFDAINNFLKDKFNIDLKS